MQETEKGPKNNVILIAQAILVVGVIIAGAILLTGSKPPSGNSETGANGLKKVAAESSLPSIDPVSAADQTLGEKKAPITLLMYEDFQCPFCERFFNDAEKTIRSKYIPSGKVLFVYRDYPIIGPESIRAAEAARCAGEQEKFWQYHDYLYERQGKIENGGTFSDPNLKAFAKDLGLDTNSFNQCLDSNKYEKAVTDSFESGNRAMPKPSDRFTPKGFIMKDGKVVDIIQGAQPSAVVSSQIDAALK